MRRIVVLSIVIMLITVSCKQPVSDFTWSPLEPVAGEEVKFINLSENAKTYNWNFGDMSVGRGANPTHVYERPGNYIVDLLAHNGILADEKTVTIVVK